MVKKSKYMLSTLSSQPTSQHFAALSCIVAAILWGLLWYPVRILDGMGISGLWSTLIIFSSAMLVLLPACARARGELLKHKLDYILIGLFAGWTNLGFILAMLEGEVVRVLLLFYLSPIWSILLAILILRERITRLSFFALILAMTGAVLMLWDADLFFNEAISLADIYAITSGMAFACTNIVIRKIGETPIVLKMGASWLGVIVVTVCAMLLTRVSMPEMTFNSGALALLMGFPFMFIMTWTALYGVTKLPIQRSSVIFLLEVVAGAVSAALLTSEIVSRFEYIGGVLIISAGLLSVIKVKNTL